MIIGSVEHGIGIMNQGGCGREGAAGKAGIMTAFGSCKYAGAPRQSRK